MMGCKMCGVHKLSLILVIVGALNWGLVGVADFNLVTAVFGFGWVTRLIYVLVGVSGLMMLMAGRCCLGKCLGKAGCQSGSCQPVGACCSSGAPKPEAPPAPVPDKK
jgi:uncharacterized membrane protein YuzA (DUF378 family)